MNSKHTNAIVIQGSTTITPYSCENCEDKNKVLKEYENTVNELSNKIKLMEKQSELITRRHEQLKQKYEDINKDNKTYASKLIEALKENTSLKEEAEKDANTLEDTLAINQVLTEEIKVKDAIIEANKILEEAQNNSVDEASNTFTCKECDWKTNVSAHLAGHMIKHRKGQYACQQCHVTTITKQELNDHVEQKHKSNDKDEAYECDKCDKIFPSEHSLKQHKTSKHKSTNSLPVGHPERAQIENRDELKTLGISCVQCGKRFSNGTEIDRHMEDHINEPRNNVFREPRETKVCRYYRNGFCNKGETCKFSHKINKEMVSRTPRCSWGEDCKFKMQNRCRFFHSGVGVQAQNHQSSIRSNKECRYKESCRNIQRCSYAHPSQGFQFAQTHKKHNIGHRTLNPWLAF